MIDVHVFVPCLAVQEWSTGLPAGPGTPVLLLQAGPLTGPWGQLRRAAEDGPLSVLGTRLQRQDPAELGPCAAARLATVGQPRGPAAVASLPPGCLGAADAGPA